MKQADLGIVQNRAQRVSTAPHSAARWPATPYSDHLCLHELIERQVAATPERTALVFGSEVLSYAELNARANRLAHYLRTAGVERDGLVGLSVERSVDMVVGALGILKAGGAYVPLDPAYPPERLVYMLEDSGASVLVTAGSAGAALELNGVRSVRLDAEAAEIAGFAAENPAPTAGPANLAYAIYTSGSTGRPKGVEVLHRGIVNFTESMRREPGIGPEDRLLAITTLSFDIAGLELWLPLSCGAQIVLARREEAADAGRLMALLASSGATIMQATPATWRMLLAAGWKGDGRLKALCGGEAMPRDLADSLLSRCGELWNMYGPTETTVWSTLERIGPGGGTISIGRPIANTPVYILNDKFEPVPEGDPGELCIGGDGVARGYHDQPELTAERFVHDPFDDRPGARMYRTGDLARWMPDGRIQCLGRIDHQVKIRGFRVELGEIESVLGELSSVREAVVVARDDAPGIRRLVAYLVPWDGPRPSVGDLRRHLLERLPEYMAPAAYVFLAELPLTPNGKINRKALPDPGRGRPELSVAYSPARNDLERFLQQAFAAGLGLDDAGVDDDFFELGGNSIQAAMIANRVQEELGEYVYVAALFEAPTAARLAKYLASNYAEAVSRRWGAGVAEAMGVTGPGASARLGADDIVVLREAIGRDAVPASAKTGPKNPPAVFVLAPPRSGSTLLRVMMAGHPGLFAPPELELLSFGTLAERATALVGPHAHWLEGSLRAVMELKACDAEEARRLVEDCQRRGMSTREFYGLLQEWIGTRLLVDKTSTYCLEESALRRAEEAFRDARYIHLLRHPHGMISSFEEVRLDKIWFRHRHPFTTRQLAELVYVVCHQNIRRFLAEVPAARQHRLVFEDLVSRPEPAMRSLCDFLGLPFEPAMLKPYEDKQKKMTDGIHAVSRMQGDPKFHEHKGINAGVADRWKETVKEDFLGDLAWETASELGYARPAESASSPVPTPSPLAGAAAKLARIAREGDTAPLSFAQQRLWFLDRLEPGSSTYNIARAVRLRGDLDAEALRRAIETIIARHESLRTTFPAPAGQPVQRIAPPGRIELPLTDFSAIPESEREERAMAAASESFKRPFDLASGPLVRIELLRLSEGEHLLLLSLHHIVSDWWSRGVFLGELTQLYGAFHEGRPSPLPELPVQYPDFAAWQRAQLDSGRLDEQVAWWADRFKDPPPALELRTDRPRPAVMSRAGATFRADLPRLLTERLNDLSRQSRGTLFMTLLAAFQALLQRCTGQDDMTVGTPVAGRTHRELEPLIGFFVNTLAIRSDLSGDPSFRDLLARVRGEVTNALVRQAVPFERLVESLQLRRDLSRSPLFDVMFILQNAPLHAERLGGMEVEPVEIDSWTAKFDLTLEMEERQGGLTARWEYSTELFDRATVERLHSLLAAFLEGVAADPDQPISRVPLLNEAERRKMLVEWNDTNRDYPPVASIHELFEHQVARTPHAVATVQGHARLTYAELNERANRVAHALRKRSVAPGSPIGICMGRGSNTLVAMLGVLKSGGAYVPVDPAYPEDRLAFMLKDAGVSIVLTQCALEPKLVGCTAERLCLDRDWPAIGAESGENPAPAPAGAAYVIYTSGSTGTPKGVLIEHRSAVGLIQWALEAMPRDIFKGTLASTSISFDVSVFELFVTLCAGGTLILAETALDLPSLPAAAEVTLVITVPSALAALARAGSVPPSVRACILAGEALRTSVVDLIHSKTRILSIYDLYGPTEDTVYSTWALREPGGPETIGRPLGNKRSYILDQHLQPVPIGVAGELYLAGIGLARGYLNRPDLTAQRFVPDPFSGHPTDRMYRTGDRAAFMPDGRIQFLGRLDHQVKLRGFRIELGEVEASLSAHAGIREALAIVREDNAGDPRLVAYVVATDPAPTAADVRAALRERLPEYMVPSAFVFLERFPLTTSGKIDRRSLPAPELATAGRVSVAPRDPTEQALATIWQELLCLPEGRFGVTDDFFELGGHSLLGVTLLARIEETLGAKLPVASLFQHPTIEGLASLVRPDGAKLEASGLTGIQTKGTRRPFFLVSRTATGLLSFGPLAKMLGDDQPLYGLGPPPDLIEERPQFIKTREVAARHIEQVRQVQPEGPYLLGGRCYGGAIALEMAHQLRALGQEVALVVLIGVGFPPGAVVDKDHGSRRLAYHLRRGHVGVVLKAAFKIARRKLGMSPAVKAAEPANPTGEVQGMKDGRMPGYRPDPYDGRVVLLNNTDSILPTWEAIATGGLTFHSLQGTHDTMFQDPHAAGMAAALAEEFGRVEAAIGSARAVVHAH